MSENKKEPGAKMKHLGRYMIPLNTRWTATLRSFFFSVFPFQCFHRSRKTALRTTLVFQFMQMSYAHSTGKQYQAPQCNDKGKTLYHRTQASEKSTTDCANIFQNPGKR